ncbi:MAG: DNA recombination protein RmuC [Planctomycetes bacterium]|nr:DNA recombination protein RmuC [Planctomycetota bacterium]
MLTGLIIAAIVAAAACSACIALVMTNKALMRERDALASDRANLEAANERHLAELDVRQKRIGELDTQIQLERERLAAARQQFDEAQKQARDTFKSLASDTLRQTVEDFHKQASKLFENEQKKSGTAMESMLKPVRESLAEYQKKLAEAEHERAKAYGSITAQAAKMTEDQQRLREETANLVKALRRPEVRGRWGELQMHRLFELAGMTEHVDYDAQASVEAAEGGKLRPDFTIRLPNERIIVIDVKTPIDAYLNATEAGSDELRETSMIDHARQVKAQAERLASKSYWDACDGSPEFVVMFVPGEAMLYAAVQKDATLIEWAMAKNVVLATPTIMVPLLKTVAMGWREKSLEENAKKIADLGRELHKRLAVALEHLATLGKRLEKTVETYNDFVGSIDRNVLPCARKFEELEADSSKKLPEGLEPIIEVPRDLRSIPAGLHKDDTDES